MMQKGRRDEPPFEIDKFTPKRFMEYIAFQANQFTGKALGRSGSTIEAAAALDLLPAIVLEFNKDR